MSDLKPPSQSSPGGAPVSARTATARAPGPSPTSMNFSAPAIASLRLGPHAMVAWPRYPDDLSTTFISAEGDPGHVPAQRASYYRLGPGFTYGFGDFDHRRRSGAASIVGGTGVTFRSNAALHAPVFPLGGASADRAPSPARPL